MNGGKGHGNCHARVGKEKKEKEYAHRMIREMWQRNMAIEKKVGWGIKRSMGTCIGVGSERKESMHIVLTEKGAWAGK